MTSPNRQIPEDRQLLRTLRSPKTIREQCQKIFDRVNSDTSPHFRLQLDKLDQASDFVIEEIKENYPDLKIPYHSRWRHFDSGGIARVAGLHTALADEDALEKGRALFELAITSVLLDAGAGDLWTYTEAQTGQSFGRSEGLALASLQMFIDGCFSNRSNPGLRTDAHVLASFWERTLAEGFQVGAKNPLVGLSGRVHLLRSLGAGVIDTNNSKYFGTGSPRLGKLFDYFVGMARGKELPARAILVAILDCMSSIWPSRLQLAKQNLGDVWVYEPFRHATTSHPYIPFHKLSQWLSYSLVEPLEAYGISVIDLDQLTGLPEYRNGGLFIDLQVIVPKEKGITAAVHPPETEIIVEWRALTVCLLDLLAKKIRTKLDLDAKQLPLAKILQGGTWSAGRKIAKQLRPTGGPPIRLASDGTVF